MGIYSIRILNRYFWWLCWAEFRIKDNTIDAKDGNKPLYGLSSPTCFDPSGLASQFRSIPGTRVLY